FTQVLGAILHAQAQGDLSDLEYYIAFFPELAPRLRAYFGDSEGPEGAAPGPEPAPYDDGATDPAPNTDLGANGTDGERAASATEEPEPASEPDLHFGTGFALQAESHQRGAEFSSTTPQEPLVAFDKRLRTATPYLPVTSLIVALNLVVFVLMVIRFER